MTAVVTLAGAPTYGAVDWHAIDWKKANCNVRRLQARIVKAIKELIYLRVLPGGVSSGSSWMTRKCHVQFLGGRGAAMPSGHPTRLSHLWDYVDLQAHYC